MLDKALRSPLTLSLAPVRVMWVVASPGPQSRLPLFPSARHPCTPVITLLHIKDLTSRVASALVFL